MSRTPEEYPTTPLGKARYHLADAFALLAAEYERQRRTVWSAHAMATHADKKSTLRDGVVAKYVAPIEQHMRDLEEARTLLDRLLWALVGDEPALAVVGPMIDAARERAAERASPPEQSSC